MEIFAIIGIILLVLFVFTCGGVLGWILKGIGSVFEFLFEGWYSCLKVIVWIVIIFMALIALAS